jgi:serine/threonine protein kinase
MSCAGEAWEQVSSPAKELVMCLLVLRPEDRLSCEEVLIHPWLTQEGPGDNSQSLGQRYHGRLKHLALKQRVKELFLNGGDIALWQDSRAVHIQEVLARTVQERSETHPGALEEAAAVGPVDKFLSTLSLSGGGAGASDGRQAYNRLDSVASESAALQEAGDTTAVEVVDAEYSAKVRSFKHKMVSSFSEDDKAVVTAILLPALFLL